MSDGPTTVHLERAGRVVFATLDSPPRNFLDARMLTELEALVTELETDRSVGAVVLTGAPADVFITHFDVSELSLAEPGARTPSYRTARAGLRAIETAARLPGASAVLARTPAGQALDLVAVHDLFTRMNVMDKVFIAAINGHALAGGCEVALACDIRIMADGVGRIGLPEVTLGVIPGFGGTQRLARILGPGRALEAMLEGHGYTATEACDLGLVHRVVAPEALLDEARATAERMARRPRLAVQSLKRAVYEGGSRSLAQGLAVERAAFAVAAQSAGARRGVEAMRGEIEAGRGAGPGMDVDALRPWQDGTAVNYTSDDLA